MNETSFFSEVSKIYNMLEDELSRKLYILRANWLITGDIRYIRDIVMETHPQIPVWNQKEEKEFVNILPHGKKIVFYGIGSFSERLYPYLREIKQDILFCDSDVEKQNVEIEGYPVISPKELFGMQDKKAIVICSTKYHDEIRKYLISNGTSEQDIIDIRAYFKVGTGDDYFYEDFLQFLSKEIFVDAGCFDLTSTKEFKKKCNTLVKAYAFEPDQHNYKICQQNAQKYKNNLPQIKLLPYGTWSSETELRFNATADGCSHIGDGENVIKTIAIDDVVDNQEKITFIKMDVEGAELESLKGAKKTIQRCKPKLAICIYHKPEDMITLPNYIKQLVPEYRLYLRSYSNADNEMVLYAVL